MPTGKKAKPTKRIPIIVVGPGSDGASDSPIIITDGSTQFISINDDFHPTALRNNSVYLISKSNGGTLTVKPDGYSSNAATAASMAAATVTITLTDAGAANTVQILATPSPVNAGSTTAYFTWTLQVTASANLLPFQRFDMNGGESRIAHSAFRINAATVSIGNGGNQNVTTPKHITIHFR